ncbi:MAG TPA: acyloxyacyl hydrolase [Alphaproteobacteria bacterium]
MSGDSAKRHHRPTLAALAVLMPLALGRTAQAQIQVPTEHDDILAVWAGKYDFNANRHPAAEFGAEYRPRLDLWIFQPMVGAMHTTNDATDAFAGFSTDVIFYDRVVLRPAIAVSAYARGAAKDLGYGLEFRESAELAYRFDDNSRLGIEAYHLSNAGLGHRNPGEETIAMIYSLPTAKIGHWLGE